MAFGLFKKKKKQKALVDPTQVKLNQLSKGTFIDYDLKTWEVRGVYEYDWGDGGASDEFKLTSGDEEVYLSVEPDGEDFYCTITKKIGIREIEAEAEEESRGGTIGFQSSRKQKHNNIVKIIMANEEPPMEIIYDGVMYYRDEESVGYFHDTDTPDKEANWQEVVSWSYYDETEKLTISIDQWGESEFEASHGLVVSEIEFSNILYNQDFKVS